jgi:hypothetical protein
MSKADDEFHDFVVGFADPLTRLAFLLTSGTPGDPAVRSADALARVRRQWRDAETTGAPEAIAIEALLSALPHRRQFHPHGHAVPPAPDDSDQLLAPGVASGTPVNHDAFRRPVAADAAPSGGSIDGLPGSEADDAIDDAVDVEALHDGVWKAWQRLAPRQRVPLVFDDLTVASRRLTGLGVPESYGSSRRLDIGGADALRQLRTMLVADPTIGVAVGNMPDRQLGDLLADTLRECASSPSRVIDPYPVVVRRAQRIGRRSAVAVAAVLVVVATGLAVAVQASQPTKATSAATSSGSPSPASVSAAGSGAQGLVQTGPLPSFTGSLSSQGPFASAAGPAVPVMVVPWSPRGNAAGDAVLLSHLKSYFTTVHQDATGQTQVLLAADTPTLRIAYVTANSPNGVIQSWFYGPVGSQNLIEGATSYGGSLLPDSVLVDGLIDVTGHEQFVVIAPPDTTGMQIADFDFDDPSVPAGFSALPYQNGIAVKDLPASATAASFVVDVSVGAATFTLKDAPDIQLRPEFTGSVTSDGPPSAPLPTPAVDSGKPDPTLVTRALEDAAVWEKSNPSVPAHPVVVWGGNDAAGTHLVVLRIKTGVVDLVILEWSGDAPGLHGELLMHASAPNVPLAFAYRALDGTRIGVIGSPGATRAVLDFNGTVSKSVPLDASGFASFRVTNPSPPPSNDASSDLEIVAQVQLYDAHGHLLASVPEPPSV